jgi:hypothetical protein
VGDGLTATIHVRGDDPLHGLPEGEVAMAVMVSDVLVSGRSRKVGDGGPGPQRLGALAEQVVGENIFYSKLWPRPSLFFLRLA